MMRIHSVLPFVLLLACSNVSQQRAPEAANAEAETTSFTHGASSVQAMFVSDAPKPAVYAPAGEAEYAIRWNIDDGGPSTAEDTLRALDRRPDDSDDYEVRYFDFALPVDAPAGFTSILRQRKKGKKNYQLTFKYRGDHALSAWICPLSSKPNEKKDEVDISFLASGQSKRAYSYSCTVESEDGPIAPPRVLNARPKNCFSRMTRLEAGALRVEEWHLPGEVIMLEVSRKGSDTRSDVDSFQQEVVAPLVKTGIRPSDRSKTERGGACR